jgi:peptidoglycan L-alanyl-D-glutamate endopeptidase CwlK
MAYSYGRSSMRRTKDVNEGLVMTAVVALSFSKYDMSIPWMGGYRTAPEQRELFDNKASRCDGLINRSFHQSGDALDIVPYIDGELDYTATDRFQHFANIMLASFKFLQAIKKIPQEQYLHWGGFWSAEDYNRDGMLHHIDDKLGWDKPHWEIRSIPQQNVLKFKD